MSMRVALGVLVLCAGVADADAIKLGTHYVREAMLEERLLPSDTGSVVNSIFFRQTVDVLELRNGWARVSTYYDGKAEGRTGLVARWVLASGLSESMPEEPAQSTASPEPDTTKGIDESL